MKVPRILASVGVLSALAIAAVLYTVYPVRGSDHQDSNVMIGRTGADITDVYLFPSPANAANVVLVMDIHPLIPAGMGTATFFDPAVMYQFKITHGALGTQNAEDTVIQFAANGAGTGQTLSVFGPAAPTTTGTTNTFLPTITGTANYNVPTTLSNGVQVFAGPRADPFYFDLFQFFKIVPDRNQAYHQAGQTVPAASSSSFNGFAAGSACNTAPASDALSSNSFNVLSIVVEVPKTLITPASGSQVTHVWATTSTTSGT